MPPLSPVPCQAPGSPVRRIVVTGGPGAGKTALLELLRGSLCERVVIVPEAASIVFGGGFPRRDSPAALRAAQRTIYRVQRELERLVDEEGEAVVALCDRGTLDGLAYWPGPEEEYLADLGTTREAELARYAAVVHLRIPPPTSYNHQNVLRIESARQAAILDGRISAAWRGHPHTHRVDQQEHFADKVAHALATLRTELPPCCAARALTGGPSLGPGGP